MREQEFQRALEEHRDRVWGYVYYMTRSAADADDITQEAYLRLWRGPEQPQSARSWLLRVAHNLCIDSLRRGRRRPVLALEHGPGELASQDPRSDPQAVHELEQRQRALLSALDSLPEQTRATLLLHYFEGLDYRSIAEILDASTTSIKVRALRGRRALRRQLADWAPGDSREVASE